MTQELGLLELYARGSTNDRYQITRGRFADCARFGSGS